MCEQTKIILEMWTNFFCKNCGQVLGQTNGAAIIFGGTFISQPMVRVICKDKFCNRVRKIKLHTENVRPLLYLSENDIAEIFLREGFSE